jgi:phosphatidate cytidylyltransferase
MNENLKLRIMTAAVGAPLILGLIFWGGITGVTLLAWIISTGMWFEFSKMVLALPDARSKKILILAFNTLIFLMNYYLGSGLSHAFLGLMPVLLFFIVFLFKVPTLQVLTAGQDQASILKQHLTEMMSICFGFVYCTWVPLLLIKVREHHQGLQWLVLTLIVVWGTDTFAYFAGRWFGKHKLFESVSPKKTWEGSVGGTLGALLLGLLFANYFIEGVDLFDLTFVLLFVSIASQLGDLCESLLKRAMNVKDSGSLLPGHGGFLDRFDGVLFALPVMNAYLWIFTGY